MSPHVPGFFFMKHKRFLLLLLIIPLIVNNPVLANEVETSTPPIGESQIEAEIMDNRAAILQAYLEKYNSPMQYHAQDFVDAADINNLDWKLLPAIAGVESTFGKYIPGGFNAYGWGVYGTNRIYFKSWGDGIYTVSEGLRKDYLNRGLTNPYSINKRYATSPTWGSKVSYFLADIDKFGVAYEAENNMSLAADLEPQTAGSSAIPVSR